MKINLAPWVSAVSGKIGNSVASNGAGGQYLRARVIPSNPQSTAQNLKRSSITSLSQAWRDLTQTQRDSWINAVDSFKSKGVLGADIIPSGINAYIKLNANLAEVGVAANATAPTPVAVEAVTSLTPTAAETGQTFSVAFGPSPVPADTAFILSASAQVSPGALFAKGTYRQVSLLDAADTTPEDFAAAYIARFGALVAGKRINVQLVPVSKTTGQKGQAVTATLLVGA